jgi:hypothetical protein
MVPATSRNPMTATIATKVNARIFIPASARTAKSGLPAVARSVEAGIVSLL